VPVSPRADLESCLVVESWLAAYAEVFPPLI
jgi:hypothetical protein